MSVDTIVELYQHAVSRHPKNNAFMRKRAGSYESISSEAFSRDVRKAAHGLMGLGVESGDRVALLSENRLEWAISDLGILTIGAVNVPIYPTLPASHIEYILRDSRSKVAVASTREQADKVAQVRSNLPDLRTVVVMEDDGAKTANNTFAGLLAEGHALADKEPHRYSERMSAVRPESLASIIYTSGTTGSPKGVMLTHGNLVSNVHAALEVFDIEDKDSCLSFLPLSHIFERMAGFYTMFYVGVSIAYAESIDTVAANMLEVRPSIVVAVPRLFEKIYGRVLDTAMAGPALKKRIFFWARAVGLKAARKQIAGERLRFLLAKQYHLADKLVFSKLRERTGGNLRFFVSGGAPLNRDIAEFFYAAGMIILEGYGLTETSPVIAVNTFENYRPGTVGKPIPGVEVKIAGDGEILVRGPNVMKGYFNMEEETLEAMKGGWFHTGDIGEIDADGFLKITDRKKDLIVTAGGKNVAPQPIEARLKTSKYVSEAVLIGDKRKFISALVVPNFEALDKYAHHRNILYTDHAGLIRNQEVQALYQREIDRLGADLAHYEKIKKFGLIDHEFSQETGELTPKMSVKRKMVAEKYETLVEEMYAED